MPKRDYIFHNDSRRRRRRSLPKAVVTYGTSQALFCGALALLLLFGVTLLRPSWRRGPSLPCRKPCLAVERLPLKPEERWRYIKLLEAKKFAPSVPLAGVTAPIASALLRDKAPLVSRSLPPPHRPLPIVAGSPPQLLAERYQRDTKYSAASAGWVVQCGPFRGIEQAHSLRASLALRGVESAIRQGNGWQRIVVGPYPTRTSVSTLLQELRRADFPNCVAVAS